MKRSRPGDPSPGRIFATRSNDTTDIHRQNSVALRIRIIDPDFRGKDLVDRDSEAWQILSRLPEDVQSQITLLLLFTPQEAKKSFANMEFENPVESQL